MENYSLYKNETGEVIRLGNNKIIPDGLIILTKKETIEFEKSYVFEQQRLFLINNKANHIIVSKYPLYKQNNITLLLIPYTELDLEEMKMFIETVREIAKNAKENNIPFDEINWADLDK